jgi:hypothetical protein
MSHIKQFTLLILIVITGLFMPLSCVPVLMIINSINPMQVSFLTEFIVENRTGQDIEFTPIGTFGKDGNKSHLPVYKSLNRASIASKIGGYHLGPGESKTIVYDWDDINLSEIAIRTKDGRFYQLVVDSNPTDRQYHPPETNRFVITPVAELEDIAPNVFKATNSRRGIWHYPMVKLLSIALPFILWRLILAYRKEKKNAQHTPPAGRGEAPRL